MGNFYHKKKIFVATTIGIDRDGIALKQKA